MLASEFRWNWKPMIVALGTDVSKLRFPQEDTCRPNTLFLNRQQAVSDTLFRAQQTEEKKSFVSAARLLACSLYAVRYGGLCTHTSGGLVNDNTNKFFVTMHATLYLSPPGRFSFAIKLFLICSGVQSRSRIRPIHVPSNFRLGIENKLKEKIFILSFLLI